jgi:hypothetical protein
MKEEVFIILFSLFLTLSASVKAQVNQNNQAVTSSFKDTYSDYLNGGYIGSYNMGKVDNIGINQTHGITGGYNGYIENVVFRGYAAFNAGSISESGYEKSLNKAFTGESFKTKEITGIENLELPNLVSRFLFGFKAGGDIGIIITETRKSHLDLVFGVEAGYNLPSIGGFDSYVTAVYDDGTKEKLSMESFVNFNLNGKLYSGLRYIHFFDETVGFSTSCIVNGVYSFWGHTPELEKQTDQSFLNNDENSKITQNLAETSSQLMLTINIGLVFNLNN